MIATKDSGILSHLPGTRYFARKCYNSRKGKLEERKVAVESVQLVIKLTPVKEDTSCMTAILSALIIPEVSLWVLRVRSGNVLLSWELGEEI